MRRLAQYMSVTDQRLEWQRVMTRTRRLDEAPEATLHRGAPHPGRRDVWGGKGSPVHLAGSYQAAATALNRQPMHSLDARPGQGYDGDLVAPMIRDVGLGLAMGDTP